MQQIRREMFFLWQKLEKKITKRFKIACTSAKIHTKFKVDITKPKRTHREFYMNALL